MILKKADAFIISSSVGLEVNTNEANYIRVRNVLAVLESDFGLPVAYHSEDCAQALPQSSNVLTIEKIKVFNDFKFLVPCWQIGIRKHDQKLELANEIVQHFSNFGIELAIMIGEEGNEFR